MFEQINSQFVNLTKQFANSALKANSLAIENFERVVGMQLKSFEGRVNAAVAFMGEVSEVRDMEAAKAFWPKSVAFAKESAEEIYGLSQETFGQSLKASEEIGQLFRANFDAANEGFAKPVVAAVKAKSVK